MTSNQDQCHSLTKTLLRSDLLLASSDWGSLVVGRISPTIDVDSPLPSVRANSEARLMQELKYASHLGLPAIMLQLYGTNHTNLARLVSNHIAKGANFQVWVQVPLVAPNPHKFEEGEETILEDTWDWWNRFRLMANSSSKINLCLQVPEEEPTDRQILRWLGEPIKTVSVPTSMFLTNKKGYPVLSRQHQALIRRFVHLDIQIIVRGPARGHDIKHFQQYLEHLYQQVPVGDPLQQFARGYEDYLQCPLQPLMDNLESQTYEVFEKDPVKYSEYQAAMTAALSDMVAEEERKSRVITLMVVGAGRGPLVRAALNASQKSGVKLKVFAVEKNPNAVVTLQQQQIEDWGDKVTVISSDMREWNPPEEDYADILVSELLGSFGDNELSPECLDGAQKFLKPGGISIPYEYTSFLGPLQVGVGKFFVNIHSPCRAPNCTMKSASAKTRPSTHWPTSRLPMLSTSKTGSSWHLRNPCSPSTTPTGTRSLTTPGQPYLPSTLYREKISGMQS